MTAAAVEIPDITPSAPAGIDPARWAALSAPFPADEIELLPKPLKRDSPSSRCNQNDRNGIQCGGYHPMPAIHLHYVGHAGVTTRLNDVDPTWTWEPMYRDVDRDVLMAAIATGDAEIVRMVIENSPARYTDGGLWIYLTVLGVRRPGFGDSQGKSGPNAVKEVIGDGIRNAGMRFGIGTYLWSKSEKALALAMRQDGADPDAETQPERHQQSRPQREADEAAPQQMAEEIAKLAVRCMDRDKLRGTWDEASRRHLLLVDVRGALTLQEADAVAGDPKEPIQLRALLLHCVETATPATPAASGQATDAAPDTTGPADPAPVTEEAPGLRMALAALTAGDLDQLTDLMRAAGADRLLNADCRPVLAPSHAQLLALGDGAQPIPLGAVMHAVRKYLAARHSRDTRTANKAAEDLTTAP